MYLLQVESGKWYHGVLYIKQFRFFFVSEAMPHRCVVNDCLSASECPDQCCKDLSFHQFPADEEIRLKWLANLGKGPAWVLPSSGRVCSLHFGLRCYRKPGKDQKRHVLYRDAFPTKKLGPGRANVHLPYR